MHVSLQGLHSYQISVEFRVLIFRKYIHSNCLTSIIFSLFIKLLSMTFFTWAVWLGCFLGFLPDLFSQPFPCFFFSSPSRPCFFNSDLPVPLLLLAYTTKICTTATTAIAMIIAADTCHPKAIQLSIFLKWQCYV